MSQAYDAPSSLLLAVEAASKDQKARQKKA